MLSTIRAVFYTGNPEFYHAHTKHNAEFRADAFTKILEEHIIHVDHYFHTEVVFLRDGGIYAENTAYIESTIFKTYY